MSTREEEVLRVLGDAGKGWVLNETLDRLRQIPGVVEVYAPHRVVLPASDIVFHEDGTVTGVMGRPSEWDGTVHIVFDDGSVLPVPKVHT